MTSKYLEQINEFFDNKFTEYGNSVASLGCSEEGQKARFELFGSLLDLNGKEVLDVGAGLGHFADYVQRLYPDVKYTGYEVNPNFIKCTESRRNVVFEQRNILEEPPRKPFHIVYSIGALNTKFEGNDAVMKNFITALFDACSEVAAISMTSTYVDEEYRDEQTMYYYDPCDIFRHAKTLTRRVSLLHNYLPHDFTVVMYRA